VATNPSSATSVVLDASALIRALIGLRPEAREWLGRVRKGEWQPVWPAHLYAEVANVLVRLVRTTSIDAGRAARAFAEVERIRAHVGGPQSIETAMAVALERGLTVYDAAYVVLAEALGATLVTADRRLAEATDSAILLP
jgi:predicted nucleic acid-binding protein